MPSQVEKRCAELRPWLTRLRDPGVYLDASLDGAVTLAHTDERPAPWWEHYAVPGGTAGLLERILASSGAEVHLGRSARSLIRGERLQVSHDNGSEDFDAVVVACACDVGGFQVSAPGTSRHGAVVQLGPVAAHALRTVWKQGSREMGFDDGAGLVTVWSWREPVIATVHHKVDALAGVAAWLGVDAAAGIEVLEAPVRFVQRGFAKPVGCVVASEAPLVVYCGDWCGGSGTFSSCIVSAKAAADRIRAAL